MIVILTKKASESDLEKAREDFGNYIKAVVDIKKNIVAIGGRFHADAEKMLIENGSIQQNLWGGGFDPVTGKVDFQAIINIRPKQDNDSMEILDQNIRKAFESIIKRFLK